MTIATAAKRPAAVAATATPPRPATKPEAKPGIKEDKVELVLKKGGGWIFGRVRCDRSMKSFVAGCKLAIDGASEINWNSPEAMCDGIEERIRKHLNAPENGVRVQWVGMRRSNKAAVLVITTEWGFREDIEGSLSFALFAPGKS